MSDQQFQDQVLTELRNLNGRFDTLEGKFDTLEGKVDRLSDDFHEFRDNQESFNAAIWNLNQQVFSHINDIRNETVAPWKLRQSQKGV